MTPLLSGLATISLVLIFHALPIFSLVFHRSGEHISPRTDIVRQDRSPAHHEHEIIIAIQQRNLAQLQEDALNRSTPGNPLYQQWLSFHDVGKAIDTEGSYQAICSWLASHSIPITWASKRHEYIKASASIGRWEAILEAQFYRHSHAASDHAAPVAATAFHRCEQFTLPEHLSEHVVTLFNTIQHPPIMSSRLPPQPLTPRLPVVDGLSHAKLRTRLEASTGQVTVSFLNEFYHIPSNIGSPEQNQSVFETLSEYFSPQDLSQFQSSYGLTQQQPLSIGNHSVANCSQPGVSCLEGNLDIQYLMGVAQETSSIFWWVDASTDPFVAWITAVADEDYPPKVNSISWGSIEQVRPSASLCALRLFSSADRTFRLSVLPFCSNGRRKPASSLLLVSPSRCRQVTTAHLGSSLAQDAYATLHPVHPTHSGR